MTWALTVCGAEPGPLICEALQLRNLRASSLLWNFVISPDCWTTIHTGYALEEDMMIDEIFIVIN
jgi:hypothetical protein